MKQESTYLCLLDDLHLKNAVILGEGEGKFSVRKYDAKELASLLQGSDDCNTSEEYHKKMEFYAEFPWAYYEEVQGIDNSLDHSFTVLLRKLTLSYAHAGLLSWWPFEELMRTLNLLKPSAGPIIARQFYHRPFAYIQTSTQIEKIIYSEPHSVEKIDSNGNPFVDYLAEYDLGPEDLSGFNDLKEQLKRCLEKDSPNNSHLKIAIHHFDNADRHLTPKPCLSGSFKAIDPLMSYEASLEALLILENEKKIEEKLSSRISCIINQRSNQIRNFIRCVFRLRSKFAHGTRSVYDIEKHIISSPNDEFIDETRGNIPGGNYKDLLLKAGAFPSFLINLREVCRRCIRFFCNEYTEGHTRDEIIKTIG